MIMLRNKNIMDKVDFPILGLVKIITTKYTSFIPNHFSHSTMVSFLVLPIIVGQLSSKSNLV